MTIRLETIESLQRLREIELPWWELLERAPANDFFLSPPWIYAWWSVFDEDRHLCSLAMWEGDRLVALFPIYRGGRGPFRVIAFIGHPRLADRMDFAIEGGQEDDCLREFASWLVARGDWDYLRFREFGPYTDHPERLREIFAEMGYSSVFGIDSSCAYVRLSEYEDVDAYVRGAQSGKRAKDLRRRRRRMSEREGARFAVVNHIDRETLDQMEDLDALRSLRGKTGRCFFQIPLHKYFLKRLMEELGAHDHLRLVSLHIGDELCAYDLSYSYNRRLLGYQAAFDDEMRSESLGTLALLETVAYGLEGGYEEYDFLSGEEAYKMEWADLARRNRRLIVFRDTWRARIVSFYYGCVKPLRRRLGQCVRIRDAVPEKLRRAWDL